MTPARDLIELLEACRRRAQKRGCFETRKQLAEAHEACVLDLVRQAGWVAEPWGQGLLSEPMRAALRSTTSPVRWAPDILAARGTDWCFIDAKTEINQSTPNFSLEKSAFRSHFSWWVGNTTGTANFVYVWDDFRASHISEVGQLINDGDAYTGQFQGRGSGTPFWLIPKAATHPFSELFCKAVAA